MENPIIDLRSDTVTKPTAQMLEAMMAAKVGDDVFGDDPTVNELQNFTAALFGKEDALFCTSGTMTNQLAINVQTRPGDEVICHENAHVYKYEGGGMASNSGVSPKLISNPTGLLSPQEIESAISPDDPHFPKTTLVCLEDTMNKGGGVYYELSQIEAIANVCRQNNLNLHLDGARLFNALVETNYDYKKYAQNFDSISICLSKGLGAPVGSLLLGSQEIISRAKRVRKSWGGGMRQAGYLAAAGLYALKNNVARLKTDHQNAKELGELLERQSWVDSVYPIKTNIVIAKVNQPGDEILKKLSGVGILAVPFGRDLIRFVIHLDLQDQFLNDFNQRIKKV